MEWWKDVRRFQQYQGRTERLSEHDPHDYIADFRQASQKEDFVIPYRLRRGTEYWFFLQSMKNVKEFEKYLESLIKQRPDWYWDGTRQMMHLMAEHLSFLNFDQNRKECFFSSVIFFINKFKPQDWNMWQCERF